MTQKEFLSAFHASSGRFTVEQRIVLEDFKDVLSTLINSLNLQELGIDSANLFPAEFFPESIMKQIGLDYFELEHGQGTPVYLTFDISWDNASIHLIPDVLELKNLSVSIEVFDKQFSARLSGIFDLEGYSFECEVELPSLVTKAKLLAAEVQPDNLSPLNLLKKFNASPVKTSDSLPPGQSKMPKLSDLLILAAPRRKRFVLHLGIENLSLGPVSILLLQTQLEYTAGDIAAAFWGDFEITVNEAKNQKILIPLAAQHDGPGEGWQLEGGVALRNVNFLDLIDALAKKLGAQYDPPKSLDKTVTVSYVYLSYNTSTKAFSFSCELEADGFFKTGQGAGATSGNGQNTTTGNTDEIALTISINMAPAGTAAEEQAATTTEEGENTATQPAGEEVAKKDYEFTFSGQLIGRLDKKELEFDLVFDKSGSGNTIIAAYKDLGGGAIDIGKLIQLLDKSAPYLPITLDLKQAYLIFQKKTSGTEYLFGADIGTGINLSGLPLIGSMLPGAKNLTVGLQPFYASGPFEADALQGFQSLVPGDGLSLPDVIENKGLDISITLNLGDKPLKLEFPIPATNISDSKAVQDEAVPATNGASSPPAATASTAASDDGTKWFNLQKTFGPVTFERLGIQYDGTAKEFLFQLDGALSAAGMSLSLEGLSVKVDLPISKDGKPAFPKIEPVFNLRGLGLDLKKGDLELGGSFLRTVIKEPGQDPYDEYDGMLSLHFKTFGLSAIGSYAKYKGHTSLFAYAVLDYTLGGPSFFFVTGLAAGFGYNRALKMPPLEGVRTFPLVAQAIEASSGGAPAGPEAGGKRDYLMGILDGLHQYIPPEVGENFIAVGVHFTSFKLIDSFVLLAVSFGNELEIDLLGTSKVVIPTPLDGGESSTDVSPIAVAELALKGTLIPEAGFLGVKAVLTSNSFLLSKDCHLTGGFAFYSWFKDYIDPNGNQVNAGDFVLTIGGYHPRFSVPKHYPTVPRLGFNWQVSTEFHIEGGVYFALTARAIMAGAHLSAVYQSGGIKAWFDAGIDFIISWQPYYYDAEFKVELGVDATFWLFGTQHISMSLGADVHVWGPDFSGKAEIDLVVIKIPVNFGSDKPNIQPITWDDFKTSFLPAPDKDKAINITGISVSKGLVKKVEQLQKTGTDKITWYVINPKDLQIDIETAIPVTNAVLTGGGPSMVKSGPSIGMGPMGIGVDGAKIELTYQIKRMEEIEGVWTESKDMEVDFELTEISKAMPAAVWGGKLKPEVNDARFINAMAGIRLTPKQGPRPEKTHEIDKENLNFTITNVENAFSFEQPLLFNEYQTESKDLRQKINDKQIIDDRNELLESLGFQVSKAVQLTDSLVDAFIETPQLQSLKPE